MFRYCSIIIDIKQCNMSYVLRVLHSIRVCLVECSSHLTWVCLIQSFAVCLPLRCDVECGQTINCRLVHRIRLHSCQSSNSRSLFLPGESPPNPNDPFSHFFNLSCFSFLEANWLCWGRPTCSMTSLLTRRKTAKLW